MMQCRQCLCFRGLDSPLPAGDNSRRVGRVNVRLVVLRLVSLPRIDGGGGCRGRGAAAAAAGAASGSVVTLFSVCA